MTLGDRDRDVREQLDRIGPRGRGFVTLWTEAAALRGPSDRWVHGDLHPGNALLDAEGSLTAVIDFGDLCAGDPAVDLAAAWLFFGPGARRRFVQVVDELGDYDDGVWVRAKGWALAFSLGLLFESDGTDRMTSLGWAGLAALSASD